MASPCRCCWASGPRTEVPLRGPSLPWAMYTCFLPLTQLTFISLNVRPIKCPQTLIFPRNWRLHLPFTVIHFEENQRYWSFPFCSCEFRAHHPVNMASPFPFLSHWLQELGQRDHGYLTLTLDSGQPSYFKISMSKVPTAVSLDFCWNGQRQHADLVKGVFYCHKENISWSFMCCNEDFPCAKFYELHLYFLSVFWRFLCEASRGRYYLQLLAL